MPDGRVLSFIDLRRFAATVLPSLKAGAFPEASAPLALAPGSVSVATLNIESGNGTAPAQQGDIFIILIDGDLTLSDGDDTVTLGPDASAVLPRGLAVSWSSREGARALVMRCAEPGGAGADKPVAMAHDAALEPSGAPLAELLLTPTPSCRNNTLYKSASGSFMCGVWDSTPYHRRAMTYRHYELMHLLAGSVTFIDAAGREGTFRQGDIFLVEQGASCSWESRDHVAKVFAIYRPA